MIEEIAVKNFKTLRDVKIPLAPGITVMVGANNSGKSNALAVLKLMSACAKTNNPYNAVDALGGAASIVTRGVASTECVISVRETDCVQAGWTFGFHANGNPEIRLGDPWLLERESLARTSVHDFSVAALRAPALVQQGVSLGPDGRDVAAVLDNLAGEQPSLRDEIDQMVQGSAREVKRIVTRPGVEPGTKVVGVEERDGRIYGADDMSDGLLLFIGLAVAAQLKKGEPSILAIEEPERGIHPRRLRELIDHLNRLTQSGTQVILTTHSPTLLDEFRDTPESVLIFDRDAQGTHVSRLSDRPEWASELKGAPLGDLWYSGVLGGVPGR